MADDRHPQCVLVAEQLATATALADWLTDKGFPAQVVTPEPLGGSGDSLGISEAAAPVLEVRVLKPEHVEPARAAIEEQKEALQAIRARQQKRAERTGTVTAVCEECGKSSEWPASEMGTTQDCPHCGEYMDVPDPDENWDDVDFGTEDEAEGDSSEPK